MCGYLKWLYSPYNLKQTETTQPTPALRQPPIAQGATPFLNAMIQDPYHIPLGPSGKNVHFDEESLPAQTLDHLNDTLTCMRMFNRQTNPTSHKEDTKSFALTNATDKELATTTTDPLVATVITDEALLLAEIETEVSLTPAVGSMIEALPPRNPDHPIAPLTRTKIDASIVMNMDTLHVIAPKEENQWMN